MALLVIMFALLPGFAWLIFYLGEDPHPEPKRLIVFTFVVGMAFGFFTIVVEQFFTSAISKIGIQELSILSLFGLALIEECMKFAGARFALMKTAAWNDPIDRMIYMIIAALGFATLENIGAIANIPPGVAFVPIVFETLSFRFVGATLLHTLTSGIVGYYWALGLTRGRTVHYLISGILLAGILHAFFNYLILNYGNVAYSVVFLVVVGFFVLNDFEKLKTKPT